MIYEKYFLEGILDSYIENCLKQFIRTPTSHPTDHDLARSHWVLLNRLWSLGRCTTPQHVLSSATLDIRGTIETVGDKFGEWLNTNIILTRWLWLWNHTNTYIIRDLTPVVCGCLSKSIFWTVNVFRVKFFVFKKRWLIC